MKAIVYREHGSPDVLRCEEVEKPAPGDDHVLIKVRAASLNPLDWRLMLGGPYLVRLLLRVRMPKVPGVDVAGVVESVGKNVTQFRPGDAVFGVCEGACAEYACAPQSKLAIKPDQVTFEQAASLPVAGLTALQGLRDQGQLQPGQKVLINGAAGGVGTFAVQVGKVLGAHVTGVCSTGKVDMVRSLGADEVIDYTRENFTQRGQRYDLILDNVGNHSLSACRRVLNPHGKCVIAGGPKQISAILTRALRAVVSSWFVSQKIGLFMARITPADLTILARLIETGQVTPVVERQYGLREVPEAFRYLEDGHVRGKLVVMPETVVSSP